MIEGRPGRVLDAEALEVRPEVMDEEFSSDLLRVSDASR
jgi:hypothetical protein